MNNIDTPPNCSNSSPPRQTVDHLFEADRLFFDAAKKIQEGQTAEAMQILTTLLERFPTHGRAHNHLGFLYETKYRDYAKAEEHYRLAMKYAPDYPATYLNCSTLYSTIEKFDELEKLLEKAFKIPGINKDRLYNEYGIMCELQERYDEAVESYKKAIKYSLNDQDINIYKKNIQRCRMKRDHSEFGYLEEV